jgi:hypothetical protein
MVKYTLPKKTRYRTINNGHWDILEYEAEKIKNFIGYKYVKKIWLPVPIPYFDKVYGRDTFLTCNLYVTSLDYNIEVFINKHPYIEDYLKEFRDEQKKLEDEAREYNSEINNKRGKIKYFD